MTEDHHVRNLSTRLETVSELGKLMRKIVGTINEECYAWELSMSIEPWGEVERKGEMVAQYRMDISVRDPDDETQRVLVTRLINDRAENTVHDRITIIAEDE